MGGSGEGYGGINGDGWRPDLGWCTHNTLHRWCDVELCTLHLYNVNQCNPSKYNKNEKLKNLIKNINFSKNFY